MCKCKFSTADICSLSHPELVECSGTPEDKADCPFWSGGLEKQQYIKKAKSGVLLP